MSRTDDRAVASGEGAIDPADDERETPSSQRVSSVQPIQGASLPDESERTRLIADIMRLMHEPTLPDATRHAGMTLVGWLARRRHEERPHALGVDEARESERRIRAARSKSRT